MYNYDMYVKKENELHFLKNSSITVAAEIMTGATDSSNGKEGLVPAPTSIDKNKYLKGNGIWSDIEYSKKAEQDENGNNIFDTYAKRSLYGDNIVSVGRKDGSNIGEYSIAIGDRVTASERSSYAEGALTISSGENAHAEGLFTTASGYTSHSEGGETVASGTMSHAEGSQTVASGSYSHAECDRTKAIGDASHAEGYFTIARRFNSHVCGQYNVDSTYISSLPTFAIGNGMNESSRSNAFSVMNTGITKSASTITAETTADYAEFFEWEDGNINNEDRVGKFVTLYGDKIVIANSKNDYILGIISGAPFVLGNGDCDVWTGMWLRDEFNRIIYEPAPKTEIDESTGDTKEVFDEDGNLIYEGKRRKLNPKYDSSQKYISRFDRVEWSPVGMLGVLSVIQDGTCEVDGYCCCSDDGIATACEKNTEGAYRVIKKISDRVVRVVFR